MIRLEIPAPGELLLELPIFCKVEPLARPRMGVTRKFVYQPVKNQQALFAELHNYRGAKISEAVSVEIILSVDRGKTPRPHVTSKEYGDLDNQVKAINDALVKAEILTDDKLIVHINASRSFAGHSVSLIRIWSIATHPEIYTWDLTTARTRLKQPRPA